MIFIVVHEDSHFGVEVNAFAEESVALARARELAQGSAHRPEDIEERELSKWSIADGERLRINYSPETGRVTVVARELE